MARKGGGGNRRSGGGNRKSGGNRKGRQGMRRNMRRGMRNKFNRMGAKGAQQKTHKSHKSSGSGMSNIKMAAAMATAKGFATSGYHQSGAGGFGENEESHIEQEMAHMSVYDQMYDDEGDQVQQHLELLSIEG